MICIATWHAAGSEDGSPTPNVVPELVEVATRLAGVLRDLGLLSRAPVPPEEPSGEATTAWADDDSYYIEAHVPDEMETSIDVSACGHRVFVRIERNRDQEGEPSRPTGRNSKPVDASYDAIRGKPAIPIG